jgi:hypothetical protein
MVDLGPFLSDEYRTVDACLGSEDVEARLAIPHLAPDRWR